VISDNHIRRGLLSQAIRYGFRIGCIAEGIERQRLRARDQREATNLFEHVLEGLGPGRIRFLLSQSIHVCYAKVPGSNSGPDDQNFEDFLDMMADGLFDELGIRFCQGSIELNPDIPPNWFQLQINDMPLPPTKGLAPGEFLVNAIPADLMTMGITGRPEINPVTGKHSAVVRGGQREFSLCRQAKYVTWGPMEFFLLHVSSAIRNLAGAFMTPDILNFLMKQICFVAPQLVRLVSEKLQAAEITGTLRLLLDEKISIRDLRTILEILAQDFEPVYVDLSKYVIYDLTNTTLIPSWRGSLAFVAPETLAAAIRINFKRYICHKLSNGSDKLNAYILDAEIESWLIQSQAPYATKKAEAFLTGLRDAYNDNSEEAGRRILLTGHHVRKRLYELIKLEFPKIPVVSYQELSPDINITPLNRIDFA